MKWGLEGCWSIASLACRRVLQEILLSQHLAKLWSCVRERRETFISLYPSYPRLTSTVYPLEWISSVGYLYAHTHVRTYARKFCARNWNRSNVCNPCVNVKVERGSIITFCYEEWSAYLPEVYFLWSLFPTVTGVWSMHCVVRLHVCLAFVFSIGNSTPTCFSLTVKGAGAGRSSTQQRGSHFMKKNRSLSHSWLEYPRCNRDWRSCAPCLEKTQCCACERRASQPPF